MMYPMSGLTNFVLPQTLNPPAGSDWVLAQTHLRQLLTGLMSLFFLRQVRRPKGDTLEEMGKPLLFHDVKEKYGVRWNFYHRVDAHNSLKELATDPNLPGTPVTIKLASQVVDLDCDSGVLTLKDGTTVQKDVVVVADGQHVRALFLCQILLSPRSNCSWKDRFNSYVTGKNVPMMRSGQTAYRCLIPFEEIMKDEVTRPLFENKEPGFWAPSLPAKGTMCVTYP